MAQFPLLPAPLSWVLGIKAASLHRSLAAVCRQNNWQLIDSDIAIKEDWMATDGYHPNADGYAIWGAAIADAIASQIQRLDQG